VLWPQLCLHPLMPKRGLQEDVLRPDLREREIVAAYL
jgi:hypothetical protein